MESIERRISNIFENEDFERKQYESIFRSIINHLTNLAIVASSRGVNGEFILKIVAFLDYIREIAHYNEVYLITLKVTNSLYNIGKVELQFKRNDIAKKAISDSINFNNDFFKQLMLKNIYEHTNKDGEYIRNIGTVLIEVIDSIKDVGIIAAKQKNDSITINIVEILIKIEKIAVLEMDESPGFTISIMDEVANKADESLWEIRRAAKEQDLESVLQTFKKKYDDEMINPKSTNYLRNQGLSSFSKNEHDKTIVYYNKVLKRNPENDEAWGRKGHSHYMIGEYQEALKACDKAIKMKPDYSLGWHTKAYSLMSLKRYNEALEAVDKLLDLEPDNSAFFGLKGRSLEEIELYEEALDAFDRAIEGKPDNSYYWFSKGNLLFFKLSRFNDALETFDDGLKINPDDVLLLEQKAILLRVTKRYEEALEIYDELLKIKPQSTQILSNKGDVLLNLNRLEEALNIYDKLLIMKPDHVKTYVDQGDVRYKLERFDESIISYDRAIKLKPDYNHAWYNKSLLLFELGRNDEAFEAYNKIDPFFPKELFKHTLYQRALDYSSIINKDLALSCLQCAINFDKSFKEKAKKDDLFKELMGDEDFKKIVGCI